MGFPKLFSMQWSNQKSGAISGLVAVHTETRAMLKSFESHAYQLKLKFKQNSEVTYKSSIR